MREIIAAGGVENARALAAARRAPRTRHVRRHAEIAGVYAESIAVAAAGDAARAAQRQRQYPAAAAAAAADAAKAAADAAAGVVKVRRCTTTRVVARTISRSSGASSWRVAS